MSKLFIHTAMSVAKTYMKGQRKGSDRKAWKHPHDVVKEMKSAPWWPYTKGFPYDENILVASAWLLDVIEDGTHDDGSPATYQDIFDALYEVDTIDNGAKLVRTMRVVEALTCTDDTTEGKKAYLEALRYGPQEAIVVKALDRIVNLHEGIRTFSIDWHARYSRKTWDGFVPILATLPPPWGPWLMDRLICEMLFGEPFGRYEVSRD